MPPLAAKGVRIGPEGVPDLTLGWQILEWQFDFLRQPDGPESGSPWTYTPEQLRFVLWWYAVDELGRFGYRRGVLRRMKGWGKDPLVASLACTEFVGPCRFAGWDAQNQPVAKPHSAPWVQIAAVSKDQTRNTMTLFPGMLSPAAMDAYGIDMGKEIIHSRAGGRIEAVTSSPRALEGGRPTFVVANETHHWLENNEGVEMGRAISRNLGKSRDGSARSLAITNAHDPGEGSVAELDWEAWQAISDGRSSATGFLYDSLEAPPETLLAPRFTDDMDMFERAAAKQEARASARAGLVAARGDSTWLDVDRLLEEIYDPATPASMSRRFYFNQLVASEDAWIAPYEWGECADATQSLADGDMVTLGFDGSVREDSTALVACRVEDGLIQLLGCWEKPDGPAGDDWQVDRVAVDAAVYRAFEQFKVLGFYCDPPFFQDYVDKWAAEFAVKLRVRANQSRPLEWWTNRPKAMVDALERFHEAVMSRQLVHDGDATLTRHVSNARRRLGRSGITISKEHPSSPRKIDAAMAAVLAYEARADAVTLGFARPRRRRRAHGF